MSQAALVLAGAAYRIAQHLAHMLDLRVGRGIGVDALDQFVEQAELGKRRHRVRHRHDGFTECVECFDRATRDACGRFLAHGMHHRAGRVERDDPVRLIAVREECTGHGRTDDQRNHRMPGVARRCIGIDGGCAREVKAERFFAVAVCLALHVDNRHDRTARVAFFVQRNHLAHCACELPALFEADDVIGRARKAVLRIGHDGDEARGFVAERSVAAPHRRSG